MRDCVCSQPNEVGEASLSVATAKGPQALSSTSYLTSWRFSGFSTRVSALSTCTPDSPRWVPTPASHPRSYKRNRRRCARAATPLSQYASQLSLESHAHLHSPVSSQHLKFMSAFHRFILGLSPTNHIRRSPQRRRTWMSHEAARDILHHQTFNEACSRKPVSNS